MMPLNFKSIVSALLFFEVLACHLSADEPSRELGIHLVQANNQSAYSFVRAKFEPGELADPWCVRFVDPNGKEVPYFVWDFVTWKVAREGRPDWGNRYAILNHHPGNAPEALGIRARRLDAVKEQLPELASLLTARDEAAQQSGNSVCAALYLLRYQVPPLEKDKLTLRIYAQPQVEPMRRTINANQIDQQVSVAAGDIALEKLPHETTVRWKGKDIFRYGGFELGDKSTGTHGPIMGKSHACVGRPFAVEILEGIITEVRIHSQSDGRASAGANWQCTYWLFPDGGYVALKGFSLENAEGYLGGDLSMARLQSARAPELLDAPTWEKPWWLYQTDDSAFVGIHQFADVPLAVGYANNPFNVSTPGSHHVGSIGKEEDQGVLSLNWTYDLTDKRFYRFFHPRLDNNGSYDLTEVTDLRETLTKTGRLTKVPAGATTKDGTLIWPPERVTALEEALQYVKWTPREDWLYRQYLVGCGENADAANDAVRQILGAAAGWVDRPIEESEIAELIVQYSLRKSNSTSKGFVPHSWVALPSAIRENDPQRVAKILLVCSDPARMAQDAMAMITKHQAAGGDPIQGATKAGGEGWHNNPAYAGVSVPEALRFFDHFQLYSLASLERREYREVLLEWADFSLATLGGTPFDVTRLRDSFAQLWPNRVVMLIPLMLRAYGETNDEKYADVSRLIFDELLMHQAEKNPHGYFWAWGQSPQKAELFDTNYNIAAYDRGIIDFWSENRLDIIGRNRAAQFTAAQARYLVFSGQISDTLETDSMTAVQSQYAGAIPFAIGQTSLLLYDDFQFYRGLIGDLIRWSAIDDGATLEHRDGRRNLFSMKIGTRGLVFWAYGISGGQPSASKTARTMLHQWLESANSQRRKGKEK